MGVGCRVWGVGEKKDACGYPGMNPIFKKGGCLASYPFSLPYTLHPTPYPHPNMTFTPKARK